MPGSSAGPIRPAVLGSSAQFEGGDDGRFDLGWEGLVLVEELQSLLEVRLGLLNRLALASDLDFEASSYEPSVFTSNRSRELHTASLCAILETFFGKLTHLRCFPLSCTRVGGCPRRTAPGRRLAST